MPSVLFVFSSAMLQGWYLPKAAHPYYVLAPHVNIDFTSPNGTPLSMTASVKFLVDEPVKAKLASAKKLSEVSAKDYDAVDYIGGHGPVFDLAVDPGSIGIGDEFCQSGEIVSAVCHGLAALEIPFSTEDWIVSLGGKYTTADKPYEPKVVDGLLLTGNPGSSSPLGEEIRRALRK
ncbi:ThiJ/PfpI [Mycena olivaceomarginata]|nr:ThiJ/PfpI [Mycena olivaceomarginata]